MSPPRLVAPALLALGMLAGCSAPEPGPDEPAVSLAAPDPSLDALYNQRPDWQRCGSGAHCATVEVPVDWADPGGETWPMAISRRPAGGERRGVLVVNYGGPGVASAEILKAGQVPTKALAEHLDVVSFDPRGTGHSRPVACLDDRELDELLSHTAVPGQEAADALASSETFAQACVASDGRWASQLGTLNVVRDLDLLRSVLDQEKLNYLGYSYGSLIGALYADEFGSNVGHVVLDGAMDPGMDYDARALAQAESLERALGDYVDACLAGQAGECPFSGDRTAAMAQVGELMTGAGSSGLATDSDRRLTGSLALAGTISCLYDKKSWPALTDALSTALDGDGTDLLALADTYSNRTASGRFSSNVSEAFWAITCSDYPWRGPIEDARADEIRRVAPTLGPQLAYGQLICARWPATAGLPLKPTSAPDAPPIVVIGSTGDPATPYAWSESLAGQLERGRLVTYDGPGHTIYGKQNACINAAVDDFLLDGALPKPGLTCV